MTQWANLLAPFKRAIDLHGRIDHAFANAGIATAANYLEDKLDDNGQLTEPSTLVFDVNLKAVINTAYIGMHYMRKQDPPGGSVIMTASASSFQRFRVADYCTTKHGVLGFMRGMVPNLQSSGFPIRINALSPSWTATNIVPEAVITALGNAVQGPDVVARSAAILMADEARQGQLIYSFSGRFFEIEAKFLKVAEEIVGETGEDMAIEKMLQQLPQNAGAQENA